MQHGAIAWHTPEEMQLISNAAHVVEGAIIMIVAVIALAQAIGYALSGRRRFAWPSLLLAAGVFLLLYLLIPWHGFDQAVAQWQYIFTDPQQRQHFAIAVALTLAGGAEVLHVRRADRWLAPVFPLATVAVGIAFFMHTQHGTTEAVQRAVLIHKLLGMFLGSAGVLAMTARIKPQVRWLQFAWPAALLIAAVLLFVYREPAGAYH
jgi:hypothetical protein